jgi:hypothetical protein
VKPIDVKVLADADSAAYRAAGLVECRKGAQKVRIGIATDHGGFALKEELVAHLKKSGHEVIEFGAYSLNPADDYPDFVIPLAQAVAAGKAQRESRSAEAAWEPRCAPIKFQESAPGWFTITIPPSRESRMTT